ncbi:MAG: MbtH family protein [Pseudonocardiaceae bacterium]
MSTNPFDDENATFSALINSEGQYSLWPTFAPIPEGWTVTHGPAGRRECLDHIEANWTDMRPKSLVAQMERHTRA